MTIRVKKPITKSKLERTEEQLAKKRLKKGFDAQKFSGKLKGVFGDSLKYQKKVRNEWN